MAHTGTSDAIALMIAISWAGLLRAGLSSPSDFAVASSIETISVIVAVAGAGSSGTVVSGETSVALAGGVGRKTGSMTRASVRADLGGTVLAFITGIAVAHTILAESSIATVAWAGTNRTVSTTELALAITGTVVAGSLTIAVSRTLESAAVFTAVSAAAIAGKVATNSVSSALIGASAAGAVISSPSSLALADSITTLSVVRAL